MKKLMLLAGALAFATGAAASAVSAQPSPFVHPDLKAKFAGGIVDQNGNVVAGSGYKVVHNGTGSYTITYPANYFKTCPVVSIIPAGVDGDVPIANAFSYGCGSGGVSLTVLILQRGNGAVQDNPFHFTLNSL